jgi:hypothetical protein
VLVEKIFSPLQNISKRWSTKMNVFGLNFEPNTSTLFDSVLLIFYNGRSILLACVIGWFNFYFSLFILVGLSCIYSTVLDVIHVARYTF